MTYRGRFSLRHGASALSFQLADSKLTEYICCFDGFESLKKALKAAKLPAEIAYPGVNATVYEVTDKQLHDLGFAIE